MNPLRSRCLFPAPRSALPLAGLLLLALAFVPRTALAYPKVSWVSIWHHVEARRYGGGENMRFYMGGFVGKWDAFHRWYDAAGWHTLAEDGRCSNEAIFVHHDFYDNWIMTFEFRLSGDGMNFQDAVEAYRRCYYVCNPSSDWDPGTDCVTFVMSDGTAVTSGIYDTRVGWLEEGQHYDIGSVLADLIKSKYTTPFDVSCEGGTSTAKTVNLLWNTSATVSLRCDSPDGAVKCALESVSNPTLLPASGVNIRSADPWSYVDLRPASGQLGRATVVLKLSMGSIVRNFTINLNVTRPAVQPTMALGADTGDARIRQTTSKTFSFTVGDQYTAPENLVVSASSANTSVLPDSAFTFGGSGASRTLTINATGASPGTSQVTVSVRNGDGQTASRSFTVTIRRNEDRAGKPQLGSAGAALSFNGTDDVVTLPPGKWVGGNFTLEGWVYVRQHKPWASLIELGNGPAGNLVILCLSYLDNSGKASLHVTDVNGRRQDLVATSAIPLNTWTHVAASIENGRARIYYNANLVAEGDMAAPSSVDRSVNTIGKSTLDPTAFFDGIIHEVRIWNGARSQGQLRFYRFPPNAATAAALAGDPNLVGYWPMDAGTGNDVAQAATQPNVLRGSGTATALFPVWVMGVPSAAEYRIDEDSGALPIPITLSGAGGSPTWTLTEAPVGGTLAASSGSFSGGTANLSYTPLPNFNSGSDTPSADNLTDGFTVTCSVAGVAPLRVNVLVRPANDPPTVGNCTYLALNSGYVEAPGSASALSMPLRRPFTLEAWIRPTACGGPIIAKKGEYYLGLDSINRLRFYRLDRPDIVLYTVSTVPLNTWTHVAATFDGLSRRLFINGELAVEDSGPIDNLSVTTSSCNLQLGVTDLAGEPTKSFRGGLDEVRVWGNALGSAEIGAAMERVLRGSEDGLLAYYRFEENQGTTAYDLGFKPLAGASPLDARLCGATAWQARTGSSTVAAVDEDTATDIVLPSMDVDRRPAIATGTRDTLSYQIVIQPQHGRILKDNMDGTVTYLPDKDYNGADSLSYTVSDGQAVSAVGSVQITVRNVNDLPVVEPLPNLTLPDGEETVTQTLTMSDVDGPQPPSVSRIFIDQPRILPSTNVVLATNAVTRKTEIRITPPSGVYGTVRVTANVTDGEATVPVSFVVTLVPSLAYSIIDLGDLAQSAESAAVCIDEASRVGGSSGSGNTLRGLLYTKLLEGGALEQIGLPDLLHRITGLAVGAGANAGLTFEAGSYLSNNVLRAFRRVGGALADLNWNYGAEVRAINRNGTVAGVATNAGVARAFLLPRSLGTLTSARMLSLNGAVPSAMDDNDNVVGYCVVNGVERGFLAASPTDTPLILNSAAGYGATRPLSITADGTTVAGYLVRTSDNRPQAALYSTNTGSWTVIPTSAWLSSRANGINNARQVVGDAVVANGATNAFLFQNNKVYNLNSLLPPDSDWTLETATAINGLGQIAGVGTRNLGNGQIVRRAFLAVPASIIGAPVVRPLGAVARPPIVDLLEAKTTDTPSQSLVWSDVEKTLYAVRPVKARVRWQTGMDLTSTNAGFVVSFVANIWPQRPQIHAAGAPVYADPEVASPYKFFSMEYTDVPGGNLEEQTKVFTTPTNATGYTVMRYLRTDGMPPDVNAQSNAFTVARTYTVPQLLAGQSSVAWPIGTPIVDTGHKDPSGRNGYLFYEKTAVDSYGPNAAYDRQERPGPIIPVNEVKPAPPVGDARLVVVWYSMNSYRVAWAERPVEYSPAWPEVCSTIVLARADGSGAAEPIRSPKYTAAHVYNQPDPALPGFNPNEEHALMVGETLFATRCDLNRIRNYSQPYTLLKYRDPGAALEWRFRVFKVVAEQAPWFFVYPGVAGTEIQPPLPLSVLPLAPQNRIFAGQTIALKDFKGKIYARAAGPNGMTDTNLVIQYYYPLQEGFHWLPEYGLNGRDVAVGTFIPWLDQLPGGTLGTPVNVRYEIRWPEAPVLDVGETLLRAKHGLPSVADMAAVRLVYDSLNPNLTNVFRIGPGYMTAAPTNLARLYDPLSERYVKLGAAFQMPDAIRLVDGPGGRKVFADLPYPIRLRLSFDPVNKWLYFKGHLDETGIGEPLLLPNIMSQEERDRIKALDGANSQSKFDDGVNALYVMTRNPNQLDLNKDGKPDEALLTGFQYLVTETNYVNGLPTYQYDEYALVLESLPAGPKALTAAVGENVPGRPNPGYALSLSNTLSSFLSVTNLPTNTVEELTWEAWVHRRGVQSEDIVLSWGQDANGLQAGFDNTGHFYFRMNGIVARTDAAYPDLNEWHHWAGVFDVMSLGLYIYRDGQLVGSEDLDGDTWTSGGELRIGSGAAREANAGFYGYLDEVRLWVGRARSQGEIYQWQYQTLLAKTEGLTGYWQMNDQGSGSRDASGFGYQARLVGSATGWGEIPDRPWGVPPRYVALIENDDRSLGSLPVSVKIIQIGPGPFGGDLKVLYPDNVFDERLSLRVSSDFAGQPERFTFEWYYKPDAPNFRRAELPEVNPNTGEITDAHGWVLYTKGAGKNMITIGEGGESGLLTLSDNWFISRYRGYNVGNQQNVWSLWIGDPSSKSQTWPMLAEGWVKRVIRGLNPFDERVSNLAEAAASTKVSMLQQAGQRYEGDIAFNPSADNLNRIGLIEAYETVLRRARSLSTDGTPPVNYQPANNALLMAASRIADLYTMRGNEAYADATDPTVGFTTDNPNTGLYGNTASSIFAFQNQVDSLLEEELCLLRGRDDISAGVQGAPLYNRLFWNFTLGDGEVAYVNVYNLTDQNGDGRVDEKDARIMFPQGHGDAWGHYLTATATYYELLRNPNFTWVPRSESVLVAGVPLKVDYLDERKFALAAASKAKVGAEIMDLTYRRNYVEDPGGQWQGYTDTDPARAWGVDDWASRAACGAYFDWLILNAILPAVDPDPAHTGLDRIDRMTVTEIQEVASHSQDIIMKMDAADNGLNPLGLAKGVVPFDIDPAQVDAGATHYEQIAARAADSLQNTLVVFNEVNNMSQSIRANQDAGDAFARQVEEQERDYNNRLIEIFGYPYAGDIGPGKTYPSGYDGPDLLHYMYVNTKDINPGMAQASAAVTGFFKSIESSGKEPNLVLGGAFGEELQGDISNLNGATVEVDYPLSEGSFLFEAPSVWGQRRAPGDLQSVISDLVQAQARLRQAVKAYDKLIRDIEAELNGMEGQFDLPDKELEILKRDKGERINLTRAIAAMEGVQVVAERVADICNEQFDNIEKGVMKIAGMAADVGSPIIAGISITKSAVKQGSEFVSDAAAISAAGMSARLDEMGIVQEIDLKQAEATYEKQQGLKQVISMLREEPQLRLEIYAQKEVAEQTLGRLHASLAAGQRILDERTSFRRKTAGDATKLRYRDMAYRIFRNDAIQKYRAQFDLAARYVYLAAAAYDYESNLIGSEGKAGRKFFTDIVRQRALGGMVDGVPLPTQPGLAAPLARMNENFKVMKTQMGFNNPQTETGRFSLRRELFRIKTGTADSDDLWREQLKKCRVPDLWQVAEFRRYCRPMAPESVGPQPALVIRFPTTVTFGLNYFGWPLSGGDSAYDPTQFATKVRSAGVWFSDYNGNGLSMTPRVFLVPTGADVLRSPNGNNFEVRLWRVVDQKIPLPFPIGQADIRNPNFIPVMDSVSGSFVDIRKFSALRAYHDAGNFDSAEAITDSRLIGRSVWNTEWVLIIPGGTLLSNPNQGLDTLINSVSDIKVFFQTYAYSGN